MTPSAWSTLEQVARGVSHRAASALALPNWIGEDDLYAIAVAACWRHTQRSANAPRPRSLLQKVAKAAIFSELRRLTHSRRKPAPVLAPPQVPPIDPTNIWNMLIDRRRPA
jgi:hypothetical protein